MLYPFMAVPANSLVNDLGVVRSHQAIFVWQERFDAVSVLKNNIFFLILLFEVEIIASGKTDYNCKIKKNIV